MYAHFIKRIIDFVLSLCALIILSPVFIIIIILGAVKMKGNPFFTQLRPGKNEKIFKLIKFRSMTCQKDENGALLPDEVRLTRYGKLLRSTSLDELPELFNIIKGDMAVIGPRPLLVDYLTRYNEEQKHRHDVRPGLSGLAQINGRNAISWEEKFKYDVEYINNISFIGDAKIILLTLKNVFKRDGISQQNAATMSEFMGIEDNKQAADKIVE